MSDVTVIGLGLMGSALSRVLLEHEMDVTVWNRTPDRASAVVEQGAHLATDAASAVMASPIVIVCVLDYDAASEVLAAAQDHLAGRVLIQLSTGTPQEARAMDTWAREHSAAYLDGAIMNYPSGVGQPGSVIYVSGDAAAYKVSAPLLALLAADVSYKGERPGVAAAWDCLLLSEFFARFLHFFHAVQICRAEDIPLEEYATALQGEGQGFFARLARNVASGDHLETQGKLETWASAIDRIGEHAEATGIDAGYLWIARDLFRRGMAAGFGDLEVSALVNVLDAS